MRCNDRHLYFISIIILLNDVLKIMLPMQGITDTSFLSKYKNPLFPSTIGSALGGFRFSIIFRKHSSTSAVIGIFLVPLVVLVS